MDLTKPGFYPNVPEAEYRAFDAVNQSALKNHPTALHLQHGLTATREATAAMELGTALHLAVWQPERFAASVVVSPTFAGTGSRAARDAWEAENAGKTILTASQMERCKGMYAAIMANPKARALVEAPGWHECVAVWNDPFYPDVLCKARADKVILDGDRALILDLKSTACAAEWAFAKSCADYGYDQQDDWYSRGFGEVLGREAATCFIPVESESPHGVAIYELDDEARNIGRAQNVTALSWLRTGRQTGQWPGYPDEVKVIGLPAWKVRAVEMSIQTGEAP